MSLISTLWATEASAELDALKTFIKPRFVLAVLFFLITTQSYMLCLVLLSCYHRKKHSLLSSAKFAEVVEAGISACVQMNMLLSFSFGVAQIEDLNLTAEDLRSLATSVALSCASLGLSFAGRDKAEAKILKVPGKLQGWGVDMLGLVFVRFLEIGSRLFTLNLLHLSTRSTYSVGIFMAIALTCLAAKFAFPKAGASELLAAVFGHPGQVLEPASQLPLWRSSCITWLLVASAASAQYMLHADEKRYRLIFCEAKAGQPILLFAWLTTTFFAQAGLWGLRYYGGTLHHPLLVRLGRPDEKGAMPSADRELHRAPLGNLSYTSIALALDSKVVPPAYLDVCAHSECELKVDEAALEALLQSERVHPDAEATSLRDDVAPEESQNADFFGVDAKSHACEDLVTSGVPIDVDLAGACWEDERAHRFFGYFGQMQVRKANLSTNLSNRKRIPLTAWKQLEGSAGWKRLKKADFAYCFYVSGDGAEFLLSLLAKCEELEEVRLLSAL